MDSTPARVVLFEPDDRGHQKEYLEHIFRYCLANDLNIAWHLAASKTLIESLPETLLPPGTTTQALSQQAIDDCMSGSYYSIDAARWSHMQAAIRQSDADHGVFLQLDAVQFSLARQRSVANGATVSGILFKPTVHYQESPSWRERVRDIRKAILYRLMLQNSGLVTVYSLDPYFAQHANQHYHQGQKVCFLPDPMSADSEDDPRPRPDFWKPERITFLLFGYLSRRKGLLTVLDAMSDVPARVQSKMSLVLAGRIDADIQSDVDQKLRLIQSDSPDLHLHVENRFIDRDALADWVSRSDVVLAPYQKAAGSSGVILWAASKGTPVLTQTYGLIGRYVAEHTLGVTTDTTDPRALAEAITQCVEHLSGDENTLPYSASDASAFIQRHAPENFARILVSELPVS